MRMHGRQSSQLWSYARTRYYARSASTAAALKPAPHGLGNLERSQPVPPDHRPSYQTSPDSGKWANPSPVPASLHLAAVSRDAGPSYRPNVNKWSRPEPSEPPRRSIFGDLDVSRRSSHPPRSFEERHALRPRNGVTSRESPRFPVDPTPQRAARNRNSSSGDVFHRPDAPHFAASHNGTRGSTLPREDTLDREPAPHLVANKWKAANTREERSRFAAGEMKRDLRPELPDFEPPGAPRPNQRPQSVRSEYMGDYEPGSRFDSGGERGKSRRGQRDAFKNRGSVIERLKAGESIEIPNHSRVHEDRMELARKAKKKSREIKPVNTDITIPSIISVGNLSRLLGIRLETLQSCMRRNGMEEQSSYDHMLSADDASLLAMEFNRNPVVDDESAFDIYASPPHPDQASLSRRPPVVTIMGHVDHGKTTLLDTLRSSSVAKGEAGGITQHIGAFSVPVPSAMNTPDIPRSITFLDTPGHAAFSAMRARGAQVTDIIVLVVAADDGVMPQTREVIDLIKKDKDKVGVVVAVNKVDKSDADVDKVHNALWAEGVELEVMGGDVPSVEVSGLTGHGLSELVETISLLAELQDIRSEVDGPAHGYVLESKVAKGFGNTATVLLLRGKLTPSSHIISGTTYAKIRQLTDSFGTTVRIAEPGSAVIVSGWKELPSAGDEVLQGKESDVKRAVDNRRRKASLDATLNDAEAINASRRQDREEREKKTEEASGETEREVGRAPTKQEPKELRLIIKGDVSGSIEALAAAVEGIGNKDAITKVVSTGVGEVSESDVMLARAAEGMIIAFSVNVSRMADQAASQNEVPIYSSNVIYRILDEVKERIIKLLPPIIEKRVSGEANVLQIFDISGKAKSIIKVAGCRVSNGIVEKDKRVRVLRDGETIHEGTLSALRVLKRDVKEVKKGSECGINITNFSDLRAGDFLQFYQVVEKLGQL